MKRYNKNTVNSPPLLEAIFEVKWELERRDPQPPVDSNYKILLGRMFDRVTGEYPYHISLPSATMPDEISAYVIQHQFRVEKNRWPLIQLGQGVVTLNDTTQYSWDDFHFRAENLIKTLFKAYPDKGKLKINSLLLRYINGIQFDFSRKDSMEFLQKIHCNINLDDEFFEITDALKKLAAFDIKMVYPIQKPVGVIQTRYARGALRGRDAIIWETGINSIGNDVPKNDEEIVKWLKDAHDLPHNWFNHIKEQVM